MVERDSLVGVDRLRHGVRRGEGRLLLQQLADAAAAGDRARDVQDQISKLDEFHQNLRHVVIERDDLPLRERAGVDAHRAGAQDGDDGEVDDHVGQRVQQRGDAADESLHVRKIGVFLRKRIRLPVLQTEGTDDADAVEIFARRAEDAVELFLHPAIERDAGKHDREHNGKQRRDRHDEDERGLRIDGEGHDHRAEHDERRAQQEPQREIQAILHLIHVAGEAREERRRTDPVEVGIAERLDVGKERLAQAGGEAGGRAGGEILRRDRAQKAQ